MNAGYHTSLVIIGGSAGSMPVLFELIKSLPPYYAIPVVIVVHRQRNSDSEMARIFSSATGRQKIYEPEDKEPIKKGCIYIAPQNYHLLIEADFSFCLDYSETVLYSRPSIDVTFESAASVYKENLVAIILSGANSDGTEGMKKVRKYGGLCIAQEPSAAQYPAMPLAAAEHIENILIQDTGHISTTLKGLHFNG